MLQGAVRLSILAGVAAFGAIGATVALMGVGVPYLVAAAVAAILAGLVSYGALRSQAPPPAAATSEADALRRQLEEYRAHTAVLRHDLRGVLSPALMMSDRLLSHAEPGVQRAGNAVVRSIERATALLADSKAVMAPAAGAAEPLETVPPAPG